MTNTITLAELPKIFDLENCYVCEKAHSVIIEGYASNSVNDNHVSFTLVIANNEFESLADKYGYSTAGHDEWYDSEGLEHYGIGIRQLNTFQLIEGEDALTLGEIEELLNKARK